MTLSPSFLDSLRPSAVYAARLGLATALLLSCLGCATIGRGTTQKVVFTSEPPGAKVSIETRPGKSIDGVTPCELRLPRSPRPMPMLIALDGKEPFEGELIPSSNSGVFMLAALETVLFIIPGLVDFASNAAYDWPLEVQANLPEKGAGAAKLKFIRQRPKRDEDEGPPAGKWGK